MINLEIFRKWQRRVTTKEIADEYGITMRAVQIIISKLKNRIRKEEKISKIEKSIPEKKEANEEKPVQKEKSE